VASSADAGTKKVNKKTKNAEKRTTNADCSPSCAV
jgi:hypothetical protein